MNRTQNHFYLQVIPPGMDFSNVVVQEDIADGDGDIAALTNEGSSSQAVPPIWAEVSILSVFTLLSHQNNALRSTFHTNFLPGRLR